MTDNASSLQIVGVVLVGVWLAAAVVALLSAWRRPGSRDVPEAVRGEAAGVGPRKGVLQPGVEASPSVFNLSPVPIWWVDRDLKLAGANEAYARIVGAGSVREAINTGAELGPGARVLAAEARDTDRAVVGEERVLVGGERRLLEVIALPLTSGDIIHLALDETRRHAALTAAHARARLMGDLLDAATTGIAWFDAGGALAAANAAFAGLFGLDRAFVEGRPELGRTLDAMRAARRLPESADYVAWRAARHAWLAPSFGGAREDWMLPGGTILSVEARAREEGLLLLVEDATERAQAAAAAGAQDAMVGALLDELREGVAVFGPDGRLKRFNARFAEIVVADPEALARDRSADALMAHVARFFDDPARADDLRGLIVEATAGRTGYDGQVVSRLGFTVRYRVAPLPGGDAALTLFASASEAPTA